MTEGRAQNPPAPSETTATRSLVFTPEELNDWARQHPVFRPILEGPRSPESDLLDHLIKVGVSLTRQQSTGKLKLNRQPTDQKQAIGFMMEVTKTFSLLYLNGASQDDFPELTRHLDSIRASRPKLSIEELQQVAAAYSLILALRASGITNFQEMVKIANDIQYEFGTKKIKGSDLIRARMLNLGLLPTEDAVNIQPSWRYALSYPYQSHNGLLSQAVFSKSPIEMLDQSRDLTAFLASRIDWTKAAGRNLSIDESNRQRIVEAYVHSSPSNPDDFGRKLTDMDVEVPNTDATKNLWRSLRDTTHVYIFENLPKIHEGRRADKQREERESEAKRVRKILLSNYAWVAQKKDEAGLVTHEWLEIPPLARDLANLAERLVLSGHLMNFPKTDAPYLEDYIEPLANAVLSARSEIPELKRHFEYLQKIVEKNLKRSLTDSEISDLARLQAVIIVSRGILQTRSTNALVAKLPDPDPNYPQWITEDFVREQLSHFGFNFETHESYESDPFLDMNVDRPTADSLIEAQANRMRMTGYNRSEMVASIFGKINATDDLKVFDPAHLPEELNALGRPLPLRVPSDADLYRVSEILVSKTPATVKELQRYLRDPKVMGQGQALFISNEAAQELLKQAQHVLTAPLDKRICAKVTSAAQRVLRGGL